MAIFQSDQYGFSRRSGSGVVLGDVEVTEVASEVVSLAVLCTVVLDVDVLGMSLLMVGVTDDEVLLCDSVVVSHD